MKKPNVLFLLADDQRFDTLAALGNPDIHTPNLDRLARMGTNFTHAHIMGGTSGAVCMPSRAMLHTGKTVFHLDRCGQEIPENHTLMGEWFQKHGYRTIGVGKWHNGTSSYARSFTDGGNIFFGGMNDHWNVPVCDFHADGVYPEIEPYESRFHLGMPLFKNNARKDRIGDKHSTDLFTDLMEEKLSQESDKPFFGYVAFMAPHDPRTMPEKYRKLYEADGLRLTDNIMPCHPFDDGDMVLRDETLAPWPRTPQLVRRHLAEYYAMISHIDDRVGRLLDLLEQRGLLENTIIVYSGDNGLAIGQHGLFGKQSVYDHSVRVPLILAGPGIPAGQKSDALCYLSDCFPTLCDLCGLEIPETVETKSFAPVLRGEKSVRDDLCCAYKNYARSVRYGEYKLIEWYRDESANPIKWPLTANCPEGVGTGPTVPLDGKGTRKTMLFRIEEDPDELNNLADDPKYAAELADLRTRLKRWQKEVDDGIQTDDQR
ncbi:MAG TPA: sulfatase-like hydrolase/transferase [Oscillospiraceae bacterium]|nr:sulfatase-like hydrolase/transferase [Oscillospiraceae bacterium]HPF55039.1 sulfatase-like hydrolase/transferase [Clostridiales bacterium]HPK35791.1 sulfatase-like hydrolase/transferase [Oscillospiraceae bacterium]HPR75411.1 sulfatase-like hydrolase/transferase [Oscillospiraceae bacterium]